MISAKEARKKALQVPLDEKRATFLTNVINGAVAKGELSFVLQGSLSSREVFELETWGYRVFMSGDESWTVEWRERTSDRGNRGEES